MTGKIQFHKKKKNAVSDYLVASYAPMPILIRLLFSLTTAIILVNFMVYLIKDTTTEVINPARIWDYLRVALYFFIVGEAQIVVDRILELIFPVPCNIKLRIFFQSSLGILVIIAGFFIITLIETGYSNITKPLFYLGTAIGLVFMMIFSSSLLLIRLTEKWILSQKQLDIIRQEKLQLSYNSLQDQLNPHFLFNNLSVLKSLIYYNKEAAIKFTENFTDVYRYVLQSNEKKLISLEDELHFIKSYLDLHQERIGEGLHVEYKINNESTDRQVAPLTLQILVENALKHNVTAKSSPLKITIKTDKDCITVENNIQLKGSSYSTKTGLKNLVKRYEFLTNEEIRITATSKIFGVRVPLL